MEKTAPDTAKKTSTATFSKECLEPDLNKDLDDSDCKYTKDTCLFAQIFATLLKVGASLQIVGSSWKILQKIM